MTHDIALVNRGFGDLNPLICGWEACEPSHSFGPAIREYYLLHYAARGKGTLVTGAGSFPVRAGEAFLIRPREVTTYTADAADPWRYLWIGFDGALAARLDSLPGPVFRAPGGLFHEMLECEALENTREEFLAGRLFALFSALFEGRERQSDYVRAACDYIDSNYMNPISITALSRLLGVERTYLARIFRRERHMSMQQYLIHVRLTHAAALLQDGYRVGEAAVMTGYDDAFHFSKMFRQRYGVSPREYRGAAAYPPQPPDGK